MRVSRKDRAASVALVVLGISILVTLTRDSSAGGQADRTANVNANRGQTREKFGSSLKRLKWDSAKGTAIETRKEERNVNPRQPDAAVRLTALLVTFDIAVMDPAASNFVTGLSKNDFIVSEDGVGQQISTFSLGDGIDLPRRILLIIDTSGSQRACLDASIDAAKTLGNQLAPKDEMAIATDDVVLAVNFTSDKAALVRALDRLAARRRPSQSLQFTTLFAALREVFANRASSAPDDARQIIIFQTDGDEAPTLRDQPEAADFLWNMPRRQYGLSDIYRAAERSRATIYTVIPSDRLIGIPPAELLERGRSMLIDMERARFRSDDEFAAYSKTHPLSDAKVKLFTERFARGQAAAARVAELTGGWTAYLETPDQASAIYSRIQRDINNRYVIGYYPENTSHDGRLRHVRIEVRGRPNLVVQGRTSYYAPED
jgi:VWFA-related protein